MATGINQLVDHCYCLNLPSCLERKKNMEEQLPTLEIPYEFVVGVQPENRGFYRLIRDKSKVDMTVRNPRCYCPNQPMTSIARRRSNCSHRPRKLRLTEIAISLSHLKIYQQALKNGDHWALVCEDDIRFVKNFSEILTETISETIWQMTEPVLIFLGRPDNPSLKIQDPAKFSLLEAPKGVYSNYCYLVNSLAMQQLIDNFYPIWKPEDGYKRMLISQGKIKSWQIKPGMVAELSSGVNAQAKYRRLSHFYRLPTELNAKETRRTRIPKTTSKSTTNSQKKSDKKTKRPKLLHLTLKG